ncbi:hypothetical protein WNY78_08785 [Psychroserpens sp. AS72]|uniref:hypothetical protein n=1 Tax=Psychroserpens sp. AS72 TaxID=3135775 RepID=UPI00317BC7AC
MKAIITLLAIFLISISSVAQQGINYKALIKDDLGNVIANDLVQIQFNILKGTEQVNVYSETHSPTTDSNGLIIVNIGKGALVSGSANFDTIEWDTDNHFLEVLINIGDGFTNMGTTEFMTVPYALSSANVSGLEKITENDGTTDKTGWRLVGQDPIYYGPIGNNAIDLSISVDTFYPMGAVGDFSNAFGVGTRAVGEFSTTLGFGTLASGNNSTAIGNRSTASGYSSTAIGYSTVASGFASTASGQEAVASGSYSVAMGNNTLATRDNSTVFGAYNVENANTIFAIGNGSPGFDVPDRKNALTLNAGFGNTFDFIIGNHQIDDDPTTENDDIKFFFSGQYGAFRVGKVSIETGDEWNSENIGFYSAAFGSGTIASGGQSFAAGNSTNALAYTSTALGLGTIASSASSMAVGAYNLDDIEAQFMVGIGSNNTARNSAFVVKKNGAIIAPSFDLLEITDDKALITKEYADNYLSKIDDLTDGKSDVDGSSLFLGINAGLNDDETDNRNVGVGFNALSFNTTGYRNTATGSEALLNNTSGYRNTAAGNGALLSNTSGYRNTAAGNGALIINTDGFLNTAIGSNALISNINGSRNTALGASAGIVNNSGSGNVYIGNGAGGLSNNENNKLYINNDQSSFPLIYGEFDTDLIRIYGELEVTQDMSVNGTLNISEKIITNEINTDVTGTANMIPIAYGTIESNANILSGTGNFTASISSGVITISVNNESMSHFNTSCSITPYSTSFRTSSIIISGGDIDVRTFNSSGNLAPVTFQFVIYKL